MCMVAACCFSRPFLGSRRTVIYFRLDTLTLTLHTVLVLIRAGIMITHYGIKKTHTHTQKMYVNVRKTTKQLQRGWGSSHMLQFNPPIP